MHELPLSRLDDFRRERVRVSVFSTLRAAENVYSVASRLIGEWVDVRLYAERIEVYYAGDQVAEMERPAGRGHAAIDYRHLIGSLVRKPGAFARYRYREALFPSLAFRYAFDALEGRHGGRADVEYVRILHLAANAGGKCSRGRPDDPAGSVASCGTSRKSRRRFSRRARRPRFAESRLPTYESTMSASLRREVLCEAGQRSGVCPSCSSRCVCRPSPGNTQRWR